MSGRDLPLPDKGRSVMEYVARRLAEWAKRNRVFSGDGIGLQQTDAGIIIRRIGPEFSGIVYLAGKKFDLRASDRKKWVKVDVLNGTVAYDDVDPADPFPAGCEYFQTQYTHGDIHVTRFG